MSRWRYAISGVMGIRASSDAGASILFQSALSRMQFADIMGVLQLQTLALTAGSALFLGEIVGWRRWSAVAVGLLGGLLIIKPGTSAFNWWAIAAAGTVFLSTAREIATRNISPLAPVPVIMVISSGVVTLISLTGAFIQVWSAPNWVELLMMIGAGVCSAGGQFCMISSVRAAPLSVVSPFRYASIIWALLIGYGVWRSIPDGWSLLGMTAIALAGLYTFYRELKLQRIRRLGSEPPVIRGAD
jgi:drug/metabolite transporter (DMT)-like permease